MLLPAILRPRAPSSFADRLTRRSWTVSRRTASCLLTPRSRETALMVVACQPAGAACAAGRAWADGMASAAAMALEFGLAGLSRHPWQLCRASRPGGSGHRRVGAAGQAAEGGSERGLVRERGDGEDLVAGLERLVGVAGQHPVAADHGDDRRAAGEVEVGDLLPDGRGVLVEGDLDQRDAAALRAQQGDDVVDAD